MVAASGKSLVRSRWLTAGVTIAVLLGAGGVLTSSAASPPIASSFVPLTPCRLMDTRPTAPVGPRSTPIGAETYVAAVWGTNGHCTIPATATAVSLNVTFVSPTAGGFLAVFPADQAWPGTSNLNFSAAQAPTPNAVTSALSKDGMLAFRNEAGTVNLLVDIVGYYVPASTGSLPTDPCAAFVGTFVGSDSDLIGTTGLIVQLLAGGGMSVVLANNIDPGAGVLEVATAQEGRWTCNGTGFTARTLDMYRLEAAVFTLGRWDWTGSLAGDTLSFTRSVCDFNLPLTVNVQMVDCGASATNFPNVTAARITIPVIIAAASAVPGSPTGEPTGRP